MANDESPSALQRYLAKQKQDREKDRASKSPAKPSAPAGRTAASEPKKSFFKHTNDPLSIPRPPEQPGDLGRWEKVVNEPTSPVDEQRAIDLGAPATPPPSRPRSENSEAELPGIKGGDFGSRFVATLVDWAIITAISYPVGRVLAGIFAVVFGPIFQLYSETLDLLVSAIVIYAYYGYFYSQKGASPGKMLLSLEVVHSETGGRLTPWKAFFREAIGKFISTVPFFMGFLIVLFRDDRKALHDLLFDTRVVEKKTP